MTDNTKRTPADDVLAEAKAHHDEYILESAGSQLMRNARLVINLAQDAAALTVALDAALARNRELEAQTARLREAGREMLNDYRFITRKTGLYGSESKLNTWYALFADDTQAQADARAKGE